MSNWNKDLGAKCDAVQEGARARLDGRPALANPYDDADPVLRRYWISGWTREDNALRRGY